VKATSGWNANATPHARKIGACVKTLLDVPRPHSVTKPIDDKKPVTPAPIK
jgi:hypothetical protein